MNVKQDNQIEERACQQTRAMLSEYVDNLLPAREMWEVEKHLSSCKACARATQQMQLTVQMLHSAPGYDTSADFMAKLHARLDGVETDAMRAPSMLTRLRDWTVGLQDQLRRRSVPAFGMGLAVAGVAAMLFLPQLSGRKVAPPADQAAPVAIISQPVQQAIDQHLADVARDPFGDVAAEKLAMNGAAGDDNSRSELE